MRVADHATDHRPLLKGRLPMRCAVPFLFTPPIDMQHARGVCTLLWQRQAHLVGLHAPFRSHWAPLCLPLLSAFSEGHQMPFPFLPSYVAVLLPITQLRHSYALVRSLALLAAVGLGARGARAQSRGMQGGACLFAEGDGNKCMAKDSRLKMV